MLTLRVATLFDNKNQTAGSLISSLTLIDCSRYHLLRNNFGPIYQNKKMPTTQLRGGHGGAGTRLVHFVYSSVFILAGFAESRDRSAFTNEVFPSGYLCNPVRQSVKTPRNLIHRVYSLFLCSGH